MRKQNISFLSAIFLFAAVSRGGAVPDTLYATDFLAGDVYKISPGGTTSLFASGIPGAAGIVFNHFDGDFYVAGSTIGPGSVGGIYQITPAGVVTPLYTSTTEGFAGLAVDATGNLMATYQGTNRALHIALPTMAFSDCFTNNGDDSPVWGLQDIAINAAGDTFLSGYYYIDSGFPGVIGKVPAGSTTAEFLTQVPGPESSGNGIVCDDAGNIYVSGATDIFKFSPDGSSVTDLGFACASGPYGLTLDSAGDIVYCDDTGAIGMITSGGLNETITTDIADPVYVCDPSVVTPPLPEPASVSLLAFSALFVGWRRIRR